MQKKCRIILKISNPMKERLDKLEGICPILGAKNTYLRQLEERWAKETDSVKVLGHANTELLNALNIHLRRIRKEFNEQISHLRRQICKKR